MQKNLLIRYIVLFFLLIGCSSLSSARSCGYCKGQGWIRVFVGTGTYGVSGKKHKCPHCHKWIHVSNDHYCQCRHCYGTGEAQSSRNRSRGGGSILYPSEEEQVRQLIMLINFGEAYYPPCEACAGSGICPHCKGASQGGGLYDWETGITYGSCVACGSSGICPTCKGGKTGPKRYRRLSQSEISNCLRSLRDIMRNALARTNR
ncbi:MAG: hypothetical protein NC405_06450 [Odoribacter sp.]|nr:hypothetical protein [Odoribacter sp.]